MKFNLLLLFIGIATFSINAQNSASKNFEDKPKLVIGIVVDQMRYDYLTRFWESYEDGGFKRMINYGLFLKL
jgi:predicted AlkP superfamily pyrophosphatase or phosphodiesterase